MTRSPLSRRSIGALCLIFGIGLAGCASSGTSPSASGAASSIPSASILPSASASAGASSSPSVTPTAAASESLVPFACVPSISVARTIDRAQITDVRVGTQDGYDRVTFQFSGGMPQTLIEGVLGPFYADPSGQPIDIKGSAFLKVTLSGGTRFTSSGGLSYTGGINFQPGFPRLVQLREGGDFEAVATWYIGLNGGSCYRVLALTSPSRLVIDLEH
jgi:hypothetical protein